MVCIIVNSAETAANYYYYRGVLFLSVNSQQWKCISFPGVVLYSKASAMSTITRAVLLSLLAATIAECLGDAPSVSESEEKKNLVMVGILARNTAHTLSNFLGYLENLDYPKEKMLIWLVLPRVLSKNLPSKHCMGCRAGVEG